MDVAQLFQNGRSQAVRLPKEYRFKGSKVCISRLGSLVVLFDPRDRTKLLTQSLGAVTEDFMVDRDQPVKAEKRRAL